MLSQNWWIYEKPGRTLRGLKKSKTVGNVYGQGSGYLEIQILILVEIVKMGSFIVVKNLLNVLIMS